MLSPFGKLLKKGIMCEKYHMLSASDKMCCKDLKRTAQDGEWEGAVRLELGLTGRLGEGHMAESTPCRHIEEYLITEQNKTAKSKNHEWEQREIRWTGLDRSRV